MSERTARISTSLMACSTTPRTTRRYLDELQNMIQKAERQDVLYSEAKNCMVTGDTDGALTLLRLLPSSYRNVNEYVDQCKMYDTLCRTGIVQRHGCMTIRNLLSSMLSEDRDSHDIVRYADALHRNGFNEQSIRAITITSAEEALDAAEMSDGHRQLFLAYAESNTPWADRTWNTFLNSLQRCAPIVACMQQTSQNRKVSNAKAHTKTTAKDGDDDQASQDTRETVEAGLARWKVMETLVTAATGKGDDDATAGDDDDDDDDDERDV